MSQCGDDNACQDDCGGEESGCETKKDDCCDTNKNDNAGCGDGKSDEEVKKMITKIKKCYEKCKSKGDEC